MAQQTFWIVGNTHVDLAWKKDRDEMFEVFDTYIARVLDILDSHTTFTYTIEQAAHYRLLARRRPDLFARVKAYVQEGRLEMVGGMASTLEMNLPNGESFIRNQALGLAWTKANLNVDVQTPWLIDTFGIHAQVPQLLRQFGFGRLMANRFGGNKNEDVFISKGIDGSEILVVGRDVYSPYMKPGHVYWKFVKDWDELDHLFQRAAASPVDGPILITAYTENEVLPSTRPDFHIERGNAEGQEVRWKYALLSSFFDALEATQKNWPVLHGDLNPEFTGTFSLRIEIRLRHRKVENRLLEAEKWAAWAGLDGWQEEFEEAWWEMAYIQFHDVFTGSHPTKVFKSLLQCLDKVERIAQGVLSRSLYGMSKSSSQAEGRQTLLVANGLPWERKDLLQIPLTELGLSAATVTCSSASIPHDVTNGKLRIWAQVPAMGMTRLSIEPSEVVEISSCVVHEGVIENEYLLLECDTNAMIKRLVWKKTGKVMLENAKDFLIIQGDNGNFQIEEPYGAEISAAAGKVEIIQYEPTPIGQRLKLRGAFPGILSIGDPGFATWEADLELVMGKPALDIQLRIHWQGESSRLRMNISSELNSSEGIYEIPFGTVQRKPYRVCDTSRGEWPAHRFVTVEDEAHGLALINTGVAGVEVNGGRLSTTLLRAPKVTYAGMVPDDTSSQHGEHMFNFVLAPYDGKWSESSVLPLAQEANIPLTYTRYEDMWPELSSEMSTLTLSPNHVVLSAIKASSEGNDLIVRIYESAGFPCTARLQLSGAKRAWRTDVTEQRTELAIKCESEKLEVTLRPFEICTIRVNRES